MRSGGAGCGTHLHGGGVVDGTLGGDALAVLQHHHLPRLVAHLHDDLPRSALHHGHAQHDRVELRRIQLAQHERLLEHALGKLPCGARELGVLICTRRFALSPGNCAALLTR